MNPEVEKSRTNSPSQLILIGAVAIVSIGLIVWLTYTLGNRYPAKTTGVDRITSSPTVSAPSGTFVTATLGNEAPNGWTGKEYGSGDVVVWELNLPPGWPTNEDFNSLYRGFLSVVGPWENYDYNVVLDYPAGNFSSIDNFVTSQVNKLPAANRTNSQTKSMDSAGLQIRQVTGLKQDVTEFVMVKYFVWKHDNKEPAEITIIQKGTNAAALNEFAATMIDNIVL